MHLVLRTSSVAADMRAIKDSKIDTIGMVPSSWRQRRLKYLCRVQTGNEDTQNANPDGQYPFFVRSPIQERCDRYTFDGEGILVAGDGAGAGRIFHHAFGKYAVHQRVYRLSEFLFPSRFLFYWLSLLFPYEMDKGSAQSTVPSMRLPMLLNFSVFMPSKEEALSISSFLDSKCAEIDALMEDIRAEISTLEEYKKSVITEAVTKGLNPDAEMKDSGIAWVGKCPEHWKILKIRDSISKIESGVSVNAATYPAGDNEIGVLKTSCVSKYIFDARENKAVNKNEESRVSCPVRKGCIIVSRMNTPDLVGACGYVAEEANGIYLPDRLWQVHVKTTYSAQYVTYYLMSHIARSYYASIAVGTSSTMQNISQKEFGCMFFCVPEIEEQQAIADYLDAKCDEIAATIAEKQKQQTTLEEYKKSLIYEYVTGKKEVPTL